MRSIGNSSPVLKLGQTATDKEESTGARYELVEMPFGKAKLILPVRTEDAADGGGLTQRILRLTARLVASDSPYLRREWRCPPSSDADEALIALCGEALRAEAVVAEIDDTNDATEVALAEACDNWDRLMGAVAEAPATTLAGVKAKAEVFAVGSDRETIWCSNGTGGVGGAWVRTDLMIATSLITDLLTIT